MPRVTSRVAIQQTQGAHLPLWEVLTLESLISAVKSVAFVTPGALGFQEGAYVLVAPIFGLGPEVGLALSLLKRAKDIAIGVPALLLWQASEGRKLALSEFGKAGKAAE